MTKAPIAAATLKITNSCNFHDSPGTSADKVNYFLALADKHFAGCPGILVAKQKKFMNDSAAGLQPIAKGSTDGTHWLGP